MLILLQSYFQVAARLGDCDAQQELAFCYLNGKGCKKDMKEAARWYRAAVSWLLSFARVCTPDLNWTGCARSEHGRTRVDIQVQVHITTPGLYFWFFSGFIIVAL